MLAVGTELSLRQIHRLGKLARTIHAPGSVGTISTYRSLSAGRFVIHIKRPTLIGFYEISTVRDTEAKLFYCFANIRKINYLCNINELTKNEKVTMRTFFALFMSVMLLTSVSAQAETTKLTIDGSKGKLSAVIQKPQTSQGQQIPMVILMHGFGGSKDGRGGQKGMLEIIADKLEAQGIASIRFDFNGHGESEGEFWQHTVPNEIEDALKVYEYVRDLRYVSTISVLGHSQGGVVASMVAGKLGAEIKAAVLMAPAAVLRDDAIRGSTFGSSYDPLNLQGDYIELMGGRQKLGTEYIRTAFSLPIYKTAANYKGALCVIHGTGDKVVPYTYGERYTEQSNNAELYILPGEDHGFMKDQQRATDIAVEFLTRNLK